MNIQEEKEYCNKMEYEMLAYLILPKNQHPYFHKWALL